jgi:hypothetical protein
MCRLPAVLLVLATVSLRAEFPLEKLEKTEPAGYRRESHAIASNGNGVLVAWVDGRPDVTGDDGPSGSVRAMRFDARGERIDARDFALGAHPQLGVFIATDGQDYLVAYHVEEGNRFSTRLARVPAAGGPPVHVATDLAGSIGGLVFAGGHYVALRDDVTIFDRAGNVVRSGIRLDPRGVPYGAVMATDGGDRILFAWSSWNGDKVWGALLSVSELLDPSFHVAAPIDLGPGYLSGLARGVKGFALLTHAWGNVYVTMLDDQARIVGPERAVYSYVSASDRHQEAASIPLRLGAGYAVITDSRWVPRGDGRSDLQEGAALLRLDAQGNPFHPRFVALSSGFGGVAAVTAPDGTVWVAYDDRVATRVQRLAYGGSPMLPVPGPIASMSRASQDFPSIQRCPAFDLVVWQEVSGVSRAAKMRRFSHDGVLLGPAFAVVADPSMDSLSVVCGGTSALVTWSVSADRRGALVEAAGDPIPVDVDSLIHAGAMVFDGEHYVSPHFLTGSGPSAYFVRFERWTERGERLPQPAVTLPLPAAGRTGAAALGWNGRHFLFVWSTVTYVKPSERGALYAMRLTRDLTPLDPPMEIAAPAIDARFVNLKVAGSPDQWLLGWMSHFPAYPGAALVTARVAANGTLLDPEGGAVTATRSFGGLYQASWNGVRWELVTSRGIITRTVHGTIEEHRVLAEADFLAGVSPAGERRLLVFFRIDPVDSVRELYGEVVSAAGWQPAPQPRRRGARH